MLQNNILLIIFFTFKLERPLISVIDIVNTIGTLRDSISEYIL